MSRAWLDLPDAGLLQFLVTNVRRPIRYGSNSLCLLSELRTPKNSRCTHLRTVVSVSVHAGAYVETKHPTWHDSFKLPALKGKSMTRKYIEVRCCCYFAMFQTQNDGPLWLTGLSHGCLQT